MSELSPDDVRELVALEEGLWRSGTRFDPAAYGRVLHAGFVEHGCSGEVWNRDDSIAQPAEDLDADFPLPDLVVEAVADGVALLTYRGVVRYDGVPRTANRASLWVRTDEGLKLRFHQRTPTG